MVKSDNGYHVRCFVILLLVLKFGILGFSSSSKAINLETKMLLDESLKMLFSQDSPGYKRYLRDTHPPHTKPMMYLQNAFYDTLLDSINDNQVLRERVESFGFQQLSGMFTKVLVFFVRYSYELYSPDEAVRNNAKSDIIKIAKAHVSYGVDIQTIALFRQIVPSMVYEILSEEEYDEQNNALVILYREAWIQAFDDIFPIWQKEVQPSHARLISSAVQIHSRLMEHLKTRVLVPISQRYRRPNPPQISRQPSISYARAFFADP